MEVKRMRLDELHLDDKNARKGNVASIIESLKEFGQHRPIVVQKSTGRIIAGNHLFQAAQSLGWEHIDCVLVEDDDEKAIRRGIADNATSDLARWDDDQLKELLTEVGTDIAGVDDAMLKRLFRQMQEEADPIYPLVPKPGEKYDYVVLFADNEIDSAFLITFFGDRVLDWKTPSRRAQRSRILPVSVLRQHMRAHGLIPDTAQDGEMEMGVEETATPTPPVEAKKTTKKK
jgi:hypothetical protein